MLLNEYKLIRQGGLEERHFEYAIETGKWDGGPVSPGVAGIEIVEKYVSRTLGHRVEFFLLQGSRIFSAIRSFRETRLILDLGVMELPDETYMVSAELTDHRGVLVELCGKMGSADHREETD